jgi:hypothetical protein
LSVRTDERKQIITEIYFITRTEVYTLLDLSRNAEIIREISDSTSEKNI